MNKKYCYPSNFLALKFLQILIGSVDFFFFRTFFFFEYAKQRKRKYKFKINNSNNRKISEGTAHREISICCLSHYVITLTLTLSHRRGNFLAAWLLSRLAASKKHLSRRERKFFVLKNAILKN